MRHLAYLLIPRLASAFYATIAGLLTLVLSMVAYFRIADWLFPYPEESPGWFVTLGVLWLGVSIFFGLLAIGAVLTYREGPE